MKNIILILLIGLIATTAGATGWDGFGTSTNPLLQAYYATLYANTILPITTNTGAIGGETNAYNAVWADTFYVGTNKYVYSNGIYFATGNMSIAAAVGYPVLYGKASLEYPICLGYTDSSSGWITTTKGLRGKAAGSTITADTLKANTFCTSKDTTLEIALFTRTCTRDTLAFMTGADSLTCAYIVSPFATRGAVTRPPYVAGVVGGKLVIDRIAADTAAYDRYSVLKIKQR